MKTLQVSSVKLDKSLTYFYGMLTTLNISSVRPTLVAKFFGELLITFRRQHHMNIVWLKVGTVK